MTEYESLSVLKMSYKYVEAALAEVEDAIVNDKRVPSSRHDSSNAPLGKIRKYFWNFNRAGKCWRFAYELIEGIPYADGLSEREGYFDVLTGDAINDLEEWLATGEKPLDTERTKRQLFHDIHDAYEDSKIFIDKIEKELEANVKKIKEYIALNPRKKNGVKFEIKEDLGYWSLQNY